MKLQTAYVVLVASVTLVATTTELSKAFKQLVDTRNLITEVDNETQRVLTPAIAELTGELQAGLDSDLAKFTFKMRGALIDVNIKIGHVAGNSSALVAQIRSTAVTVSTMKLRNKVLEYKIKKQLMNRTCHDAFQKTNIIAGNIDSVKSLIGHDVSIPSEQINMLLATGSDKKIQEYEQTINSQRSTAESFWTETFTPGAANAARELIKMKQDRIDKIRNLTSKLIDYAKWLQEKCTEISSQVGEARNVIAKISGHVQATQTAVDIITTVEKDSISGDANTEELLSELVNEMTRLSEAITTIVESRKRRHLDLFNF